MEHYQKAKEAACRVLLNSGVAVFPFDIVCLAVSNDIKIFKNTNMNELRDGETAVIIYDGKEWYVIYDDTIPSREHKRLALAHGLGHKALRHDLLIGFTEPTPKSFLRLTVKQIHARLSIPQEEKEAEAFARHLLAPLFLLHELNVKIPADIARVCQVPIETAERQAEILEYYRAGNVPVCELETQLHTQFKGFIEKYCS